MRKKTAASRLHSEGVPFDQRIALELLSLERARMNRANALPLARTRSDRRDTLDLVSEVARDLAPLVEPLLGTVGTAWTVFQASQAGTLATPPVSRPEARPVTEPSQASPTPDHAASDGTGE
jgi:hypothetical protein